MRARATELENSRRSFLLNKSTKGKASRLKKRFVSSGAIAMDEGGSIRKLKMSGAILFSVLIIASSVVITVGILPSENPVVFANPDNFGNFTKGTGATYTGNKMFASKFTPSTSGNVTSITVYVKQYVSWYPNMKFAIYTDSSGSPGTFVGGTENWTITAGWDNWKTLNAIGTFSVTAGTPYWITIWWSNVSNDYLTTYYSSGSSNQGISSSQTYAYNWPSTFPSGSQDTKMYSLYATYISTPGQPTLLSPADNAVLTTYTPTFTWTRGTPADNHRIEVANNPGFSPITDNVVVAAPNDNTWIKSGPGYSAGTYYWRVIARNTNGENSTGYRLFRIDALPSVENVFDTDVNNSPTSTVDPNGTFKIWVQTRDNDNISDIRWVWLKIYENTKSQGDTDNINNHYTFRWSRDNGLFEEIGPGPSTTHLVTGSCVKGSDTVAVDNFVFCIKLENADKTQWNTWAQAVDNANAQDNKEFSNIFTVNSGYNLLENTTYISGTVENVKTSDNTYMTLRSYPSGGGPIGFDASSSGNNGTGETSITWSHTTGSGSDRILFVGVSIRTETVTVSSITYGAQSLTFIRRENLSSICSEVWYLIAPNSGTGTVTVNLSASSEAAGGSTTYTGVAQTSPIDNSAGGTGTSNSPSQSVTVNTAYSWLLGHVAISDSDKTISSEGGGQTLRWDNVTTSAPSLTYDSENSKNVNTAATTISWLHNVGSNSDRLIIVSVYAFGGSPPTTVSSITCAGTAMTLLCTDNKTATSGNVRGYTYYLTNPPSGSDNILVTFAASTISIGGSASFYNVDQTTPIENYATATGESNSASVKGNSSGAGRIAYASVGAIKGSSITITDNTSWTTIFRENSVAPSANIRKIVGCYISTNSGNITASWAISSTASWVAQIAVINPLSAASTRSRGHGSDKGPVETGSQSMSWGLSASADWAVSVVAFKSAATQYRENVEFTGLSNTQIWDNLVWTVESQWTAASVSVILQLYNYNLGRYAQSGEDGYITYTSSGTANTDETYSQTITTSPGNFRDSTGNWKIEVSGVKTTTTQFDLKVDWIDYEPSSSLNIIDITLSNVPVNYGTIDPGTENNPASDNSHGFPMTIKIESDTTVNVDIYIKGTDWSDGAGHSIGVENCKYDDDNTLGEGPEIGQPENTLKLSYPGTANSGYFEDVTPGSSKNIYFWISIPLGQWAGTYTNNVYIKAVKDGTIP